MSKKGKKTQTKTIQKDYETPDEITYEFEYDEVPKTEKIMKMKAICNKGVFWDGLKKHLKFIGVF